MKPTKAKSKALAIMFFIAGAWGIWVSSMSSNIFILTLTAINLVLGLVFVSYYRKAKK